MLEYLKLLIIENSKYVTLLLIILFGIEFYGLISNAATFQKFMMPLLVIVFLLMYLYQPHRPGYFLKFSLLIFVCSFAIELVSVSTGNVFGNFHFGNGLGPKLKGIPIAIGLFWVIIIYTSAQIIVATVSTENIFVRTLTGAFSVLALDIFIEMIAQRLDFWFWDDGNIPLQNYGAWFIISFFFNLIYHTMQIKSVNKIVPTVFVLQLFFFVGLGIYFAKVIDLSAPPPRRKKKVKKVASEIVITQQCTKIYT